jgi:hypothetical protein
LERLTKRTPPSWSIYQRPGALEAAALILIACEALKAAGDAGALTPSRIIGMATPPTSRGRLARRAVRRRRRVMAARCQRSTPATASALRPPSSAFASRGGDLRHQ